MISKHWKKAAVAGVSLLALAGCEDAADVASRNLSKAADNFEIQRQIVFYNGITGDFFATVEGRCSIEVDSAKNKLDVTCKHGPNDLRKHFLGRSDNVTFFVLQTEPANVSEYNTRVTFNPQGFIPDIEFRGDMGELAAPTKPDTHDQAVPVTSGDVVVKEGGEPAAEAGGTLPILSGQQSGVDVETAEEAATATEPQEIITEPANTEATGADAQLIEESVEEPAAQIVVPHPMQGGPR